MKKKLFVAAMAIAGAVAPIGVLGLALPAGAAQNNAITGTVYTYYVESNTLRHVTTANDTMKIELASKPSRVGWFLVNANNGQTFTSTITITSANTWYQLASGVLNGTQFYNENEGSSQASISGTEYY